MKYSPEIYAKALLEVVKKTSADKHDKILKRFVETVRKNSDQKMLKRVIDLVEEAILKKTGGRYVKIEYANESSAGLITALKSSFTSSDKVITGINPELIAGARISINHEKELDNSFKYKLKKMFH